MSEPMPFAKIRLSLMFAAEHELPIELGTDEVWSVLNKLDQLSAETGKAIARAEAAEAEVEELRRGLDAIANYPIFTILSAHSMKRIANDYLKEKQ